jgi:hypothetical protein
VRYYSQEQLSPNKIRTPEGFLICKNVPIARTGIQLYAAHQVPEVKPGPGGIVEMERTEDEVFRPETLASFEGKDVTNDHPDEDGGVTTDNWRDLTCGHVQNVRRGDGAQYDLILADLVIKDSNAIRDIDAGKREVSCGYDHDVEPLNRGLGRQINIVGNHVALVDQGRCGPRCAIGDNAMKRNGLMGLLQRAYHAKDETELKELEKEAKDAASEPEDEDKDDHTHVHLHMPVASEDKMKDEDETKEEKKEKSEDSALASFTRVVKDGFKNIDARLRRLEGDKDKDKDEDDDYTEDEDEEEKKEKAEDDFPAANSGKCKSLGALGLLDPLGSGSKDGARRRARDSAGLEEKFLDACGDAEILSPGLRLPTFDGKLAPRQTMDRICSLSRRSIDAALRVEDDRVMIEDLNGGPVALKTMSCDSVGTLFRAAVAMKSRRTVDNMSGSGRLKAASSLTSPQDIGGLQKKINDFWEKKLGNAR